jgi:hypothetical protein
MNDTIVSLGARTWCRIHAVALCGAWDQRRRTALRALIDGVPGMWTATALGQLVIGPMVEADGRLAVYIGERVPDKQEPDWFSKATDDDLDLDPNERAELFRLAEMTDRVDPEIPDYMDGEGHPPDANT